MEWLTNLLGFANNGSSPFGSLSGGTSLSSPQAQPTATPAALASAPQPSAGGMQLPGLLGKLMGQQQQGQTGTATQPGLLGQGSSNNNALLNQAMQLMKPPQMQVPQMNLLSGPRG